MQKKLYLFIFAALFYLVGVIVYACISYHYSKEKALKQVDKNLESIALTANFFLKDYHDKALKSMSVSDQEYREINEKLNKLNSYHNSTYIYSFVRIDDKILFTSSSFTQKDKLENKTSKFFQEYTSATDKLKRVFLDKTKTYEEAKDDWGNFRSILIPMTDDNGQLYVIGVDIEIGHISKMLMQKLATTTFTGLFFLLLVIPFCILYIINLKNEKIYLEQEINKKTSELRESNETLNTKNNELSTLSNKLSKYLAPQVYESLFTGKMDVNIETKRKNLTIFFSDIKDFTKLTQGLHPKELTIMLNQYIQYMTELANKYGATIDKYIGDAIMVFFGDPASEGPQKDAIKCVKMAIEMQNKIKDIKKVAPFAELPLELKVRIGISTGICTVGNFGSPNRLDYTIIGNEVNLASRLESSAEPDGILISEATYELVKNSIDCLPNGEITVKGFDKPIKAYKAISIK